MNADVFTQEVVMKQLNDWYQMMLSQQLIEAAELKVEIDEKIERIKHEKEEAKQNQNLLLYYSLLDFKYRLLTDRLSIKKDSFEQIDSLSEPTDNVTAYYYHFFKGEHELLFGDFNAAKRQYEKAEELLTYIEDEIEHAEFYQKLSVLYHDSRMLTSIQYGKKAKAIFEKHPGYEVKVASVENTLGTSCIFLKQYEEAEEHLNRSIDLLQKHGEEKLILVVRHNLGLLYSLQNLSELAIRHLSEVTEKVPNHYKALFLQSREYYKLKDTAAANSFIEKGLKVCEEIGNEEYTYHFNILKLLNNEYPVTMLEEEVERAISYFEKQGLWDYVEEYGEMLGLKFRRLNEHEKVSRYFEVCYKAKEQILIKGALK
ncbi:MULTISPECIES: tetratricopeptide repeat protein [Bacillus cereus group]|uniref:tetratricopeptide repeat protein n=1 Tax=Bacillus cereus group TaxID=86661 RepID=UPI0021CF5151|nr:MULTISPECIES: tetratricopeptide repeat protein [Bacillus cereus group]MCU5201636.1 tetratricopeptide repeat protein [Bacillus paranthracis]MCU5374716.1 tetratricopeptide repeat protein [Bacillus pacificus]